MERIKFKIKNWAAKKLFKLACRLSSKILIGIAAEDINKGDLVSQRLCDSSIMRSSAKDYLTK